MITQDGGEERGKTRLLPLDTADGIVAAEGRDLVRIAPDGRRTALSRNAVVPFHVHPDKQGVVVYMDRTGDEVQVKRVAAAR